MWERHIANLTSQASVGSVVYAPEKSAFVWKIKQLGGGRDYMMRAHFGLPSVRNGGSNGFTLSPGKTPTS